jgi:hypothetical protein
MTSEARNLSERSRYSIHKHATRYGGYRSHQRNRGNGSTSQSARRLDRRMISALTKALQSEKKSLSLIGEASEPETVPVFSREALARSCLLGIPKYLIDIAQYLIGKEDAISRPFLFNGIEVSTVGRPMKIGIGGCDADCMRSFDRLLCSRQRLFRDFERATSRSLRLDDQNSDKIKLLVWRIRPRSLESGAIRFIDHAGCKWSAHDRSDQIPSGDRMIAAPIIPVCGQIAQSLSERRMSLDESLAPEIKGQFSPPI